MRSVTISAGTSGFKNCRPTLSAPNGIAAPEQRYLLAPLAFPLGFPGALDMFEPLQTGGLDERQHKVCPSKTGNGGSRPGLHRFRNRFVEHARSRPDRT